MLNRNKATIIVLEKQSPKQNNIAHDLKDLELTIMELSSVDEMSRVPQNPGIVLIILAFESEKNKAAALMLQSREDFHGTPLLFVQTQASFETQMEALDFEWIPLVDFIPTPVIPSLLKNKVRLFLDRWQQKQCLTPQTSEQFTEQRLKQINKITQSVISELNLKRATDVFIEQVVNTLRPDGAGSVLLYDELMHHLTLHASYGLNQEYARNFIIKVSPETQYSYEVFESKQSQVINFKDLHLINTEEIKRLHKGRLFVQQLIIPLVSRDKCIGLLNLSHYDEAYLFSEGDLHFLENLALSLSNHFENAVLYQESNKKQEEISQIIQMLSMMNQSIEWDDIMEDVLAQFTEWFQFDGVSVLLANYEDQTLYFKYNYGLGIPPAEKNTVSDYEIPLSNSSVFGKVILQCDSIYHSTAVSTKTLWGLNTPKIAQYFEELSSSIVFPLKIQEIAIGAVAMFNKSQKAELTTEQMQRIEHHVNQFAAAARTHQLYERNRHDHEELKKAYAELKTTKLLLLETEKIAAMKSAFERFVPKQFLDRIDSEVLDAIRPGYTREEVLTILFSDIRSYTSLSETMSITENFGFINNYLNRMEPCITKNNGFIDKFIGDAIMALFDKESSAHDAICAAIDMHRQVEDYNGFRKRSQMASIRIGVGINTGKVMAGVIGSAFRMDSTVIGESVNLSSRLENLSKLYKAKIIISGFTHREIKNDNYLIREIDTLKARGSEQPMTVYEVFDADAPEIIEKKLKTRELLLQGIVQFKLKLFKEAIQTFLACLNQFPDDIVPVEYLKRCYYLEKYPPSSKFWDGVMQDTDYSGFELIKRRSPRFDFYLPVNLYASGQSYHFAAHSINLSEAGMKIETRCELELQDTVMLEIYLEKETIESFISQKPLHLITQVVWKKPASTEHSTSWLYGVEFVMLTDDDIQLIKEHLRHYYKLAF
ncbi:adenylate/guanylate cyclase domain-containing protein [Deltaproteobacteria bacterium TL4]